MKLRLPASFADANYPHTVPMYLEDGWHSFTIVERRAPDIIVEVPFAVWRRWTLARLNVRAQEWMIRIGRTLLRG